MKTIFLALAFATAAYRIHAEGTIAFANSRLIPVYVSQPDDSLRLATAEDNVLIGAFYGPADSPADSLVPAPEFVTIGPEPGLMTNAPHVFPLPGTQPGQVVTLQIRAWDAALGPNGWRSVIYDPWHTWPDPLYCGAGGRFYGETKVSQVQLSSWKEIPAIIWQTFTGMNPTRFYPLVLQACPEPPVRTNLPPSISILWPPEHYFPFGGGTRIKIKATASDPDGSVARVLFYAETNFIGAVTNPPFEFSWLVDQYCDFRCPVSFRYNLIAVAEDNLGARTESKPVQIGVSETRPVFASFAILAPPNGSVFPESATFDFCVEMLAGISLARVNYLIETNLIGAVEVNQPFTSPMPPVCIAVSNLTEGEYSLKIVVSSSYGCQNCFFLSNTVRVVKLGITSPRRTPAGHAQFDVVTSFPGRDTIIEASPNLQNWMPLATSVPVSTSFIFTDTSPVAASNWFYRARVPQE